MTSEHRHHATRWAFGVALLASGVASAAPLDLTVLQSAPQDGGGTSYSVPLQLLLLMSALTILPSLLLMATSFTRIIIVLSILRQALGTAQTPPNQVLIGVALVASMLVMQPTYEKLQQEAIAPFMAGQMAGDLALNRGLQVVKTFMLANTKEADVIAFADLVGAKNYARVADIPMSIAAPAFVVSEMRTGFEMGFMLFIPFLVIDLVIASILMSLGMMMVSPMLVSLPFKLLLFVSVDGWAMTIGSLVQSYGK